MKILVTGIAGFLGSHLAEKLIADGHEVYGIDNLIGGYEENVPAGVKKWWRFDTATVDNCMEVVGHYKFDVIYHCACTAYEGLSVFTPAFIVQNTLQNTLGILAAAVEHKVKRFIFCSSMSRYGDQPAPFYESIGDRPYDPYAVAKVAAEKIIKQMAETHGFEYVIAVPHNIIGPRQKFDDPFRNVASIMINRLLQNKPVIIYGDGEQRRSFSFVQDCVGVMAQMLTCPSGEIYNIGPDDKDGSVVTVNELYRTISNLINPENELAPIYMPDRPREVKEAWCSSDKIRREFGYQTKTSLEDGLKMMIEDIKAKGPRPFDYSKIPLEITNGAPRTWKERIL